MAASEPAGRVLETLYRDESRRVFATLVRLLGDFDLAEEGLQNAFAAAAESWPRRGVPENPVAWLISAGRFKVIDQLRRQRRAVPWAEVADRIESLADPAPGPEAAAGIEDDHLRLIFTCCHPGLAEPACVALTLREVCGLTTEAIAQALVVSPAALAQRIVRAKAKIRAAGIPYEIPEGPELGRRLDRVLRVLYLVFNEGYFASNGSNLSRPDLAGEAIRLARILLALLPEAEVRGLLALMLLHEARRAARSDAEGNLIPLEAQDRALWDRGAIAEGCTLVREALGAGGGSYALQAAIAALHAEAADFSQTDWDEIVGLYGLLLRYEPTPVVALNHAVAVAMRDGPEIGLRLIEPLFALADLDGYHPLHAAKADLLRRLGRGPEASKSYRAALALAKQEPERRFFARRLAELGE